MSRNRSASTPSTAMRDFFALTLLLAGVAFGLRIGLVLEYETARIPALIAFLLSWPILRRSSHRRDGLTAGLVALGTLIVTGTTAGLAGNLLLVIGSLTALMIWSPALRGRWPGLLPGVLLFGSLTIGTLVVDGLWEFRQSMAALVSGAAGAWLEQTPRWAASAAGVDLLGLGLCVALAQLIWDRRFTRRRSLALVILLVAPVLAVVCGVENFLAVSPKNGTPFAARAFLQQLLALPLIALGVQLTRSRNDAERRLDVAARFKGNKRPRFAALSVLILCGLGASLAFHDDREGGVTASVKPGEIVLSSRLPGLDDFSSPEWGRLGFGATGMYGELRRNLVAMGHAVRVDAATLTDERLSGVKTLVLLAPDGSYSDDEIAAVHRFVETGGSLLLLTDHTDLLGIMKPANRILAPYGIEVRFDTVMETSRAFEGNLDFRSVGVLDGPAPALDTQIMHGASLRCREPARPWIIGRTMFGDLGDRANGGPGAFLGDYGLQAGHEQLGDLVLAAVAEVGEGRVAVFGDTSGFQNVALARSQGFVQAVFAWLDGDDRPGPIRFAWFGLFGGLFAFGLFLWRPGVDRLVTAPAGALLIALASNVLVLAHDNTGLVDELPRTVPTFLLHSTPFDRVERDHFKEHSMQGLMTCAARARRIPIAGDVGRVADLSVAEEVVLPASARIDDDLAERLVRFVREGGELLVASGYEESEGLRALIARFGYQIEPVPLGAAPIMNYEDLGAYQGPRFAEAWRIREFDAPAGSDLGPTEILFAVDEAAIAVRRPVGAGTFALIADSWFLTDKFTEGESKSVPANVEFVRALLFPETRNPQSGDAR